MSERPILFSAPMVLAILAGRKTMTRRVVKPPKWSYSEYAGVEYPCPHGKVGDRLYVRESFKHFCNRYLAADDTVSACVAYKADDKTRHILWTDALPPPVQKWWNTGGHPWTSGMFMPRWASRITLEITGVRVERIQDISEADAIAEGCEGYTMPMHPDSGCSDGQMPHDEFRELWASLNGKRGYGWDANPWVWVIAFRRLEP